MPTDGCSATTNPPPCALYRELVELRRRLKELYSYYSTVVSPKAAPPISRPRTIGQRPTSLMTQLQERARVGA